MKADTQRQAGHLEAASIARQQAALEAIQRAVAAQDAQLSGALEALDPRARVVVSPEARERFEAACAVRPLAVEPAGAGGPSPVRC